MSENVVMKIVLSVDGKEFLMYSGTGDLERVVPVSDFAEVGKAAKEMAEFEFFEIFEKENERPFRRCMGYEDCTPRLCDEHHG